MLRKLRPILIIALSLVAFYFTHERYFYFNTNKGTYNIYCFKNSLLNMPFSMAVDEWIEWFWLKNSCEEARAKSYNPKLSPFEKERIK